MDVFAIFKKGKIYSRKLFLQQEKAKDLCFSFSKEKLEVQPIEVEGNLENQEEVFIVVSSINENLLQKHKAFVLKEDAEACLIRAEETFRKKTAGSKLRTLKIRSIQLKP